MGAGTEAGTGSSEVATRSDTSLDALADVSADAAGLDAPAEALAMPPARPVSPVEALAAVAPDLAVEAPPEAESVEASADPAGGAARHRVTGDRVNMREGPGTDFAVVGQLTGGEEAELIATQGNWVRVRAPGGAEGWMAARFLTPAD